jgi:hypothetical protein
MTIDEEAEEPGQAVTMSQWRALREHDEGLPPPLRSLPAPKVEPVERQDIPEACSKGHSLTAANLIVSAGSKGYLFRCRTCRSGWNGHRSADASAEAVEAAERVLRAMAATQAAAQG